jgi:hypothetical protein
MLKLANRDVREAVEGQKDFQANNIFGRNVSQDCYVVYSYGQHFPMYAWVAGKGWYRNVNKYSVTTSKHQGQAMPHGVAFIDVTTDELKRIVESH